MKKITRRAFVTQAAILGMGMAISGCSSKVSPGGQEASKLASATPAGGSSEAVVRASATPATAGGATLVAAAPTSLPAATATRATAEEAAPTAASTATSVPAPAATSAPANDAYLAAVRGPDPETITARAIEAIGGIERFVKRGYDVIVKPNICNANREAKYASTTNPIVVATLVEMCLGAGAKRVRVMDYPFSGSPESAYVRSGISEAVEAAGGEMEVMARPKFVKTAIPGGVDIKSWPVYQPILDADLVINVPIAKHHGSARLTLAGKNLMGTVLNRQMIHFNLGQRIADIASVVNPQLTVIDAVRILMRNGPTGGNLGDVKQTDMVIASHDLVAADAYATRLFDLKPSDISYVTKAADMGIGTTDLGSIKVVELGE